MARRAWAGTNGPLAPASFLAPGSVAAMLFRTEQPPGAGAPFGRGATIAFLFSPPRGSRSSWRHGSGDGGGQSPVALPRERDVAISIVRSPGAPAWAIVRELLALRA